MCDFCRQGSGAEFSDIGTIMVIQRPYAAQTEYEISVDVGQELLVVEVCRNPFSFPFFLHSTKF